MRLIFEKTNPSALLRNLSRFVFVRLSTFPPLVFPHLASRSAFSKILFIVFTAVALIIPVYAERPEIIQDKELTLLARVIDIERTETREVPNTGTEASYQTVVVRFLSGEFQDKEATITDTVFPMNVGDKVYVRYLQTADGTEYYSIQEPYRLDALLYIFLFFVAMVLIFGGKYGFLSLFALFISFGGIFKLLFPAMLSGGNVVLIATLGALASLFVVMFLTHGFTRLTTSAFLGCTLSVIATLVFAKYAVYLTKLTGFASEESVYLNIATSGNLDFIALLVGGIIIGVIGVIDDISVTQASVVRELALANPSLSVASLYSKALRVGRDHMGAVINTLILAYTGASLPLVLLLYVSDAPLLELINREVIATEIVRSIVGSAGLILAVPLTTLIAVALMKKNQGSSSHVHTH